MDYFDTRDDIFEKPKIKKYNKNNLSEIQQFFFCKTIFISGASGFIGLLVLEKLLRSCIGIEKIYLLVREKKGKTSKERLQEILNNEIFEKLLKENPKLPSILSIMNGDIGEPMCGLSCEDQNRIKTEVNIIIHIAACMRMQEALKTAYKMNVRSTIDLLKLSEEAANMQGFLYVSTAYSHSFRSVIGEEFYSTEFSTEELEYLLNNLTDEEIAAITPKVLGRWQNSYIFTKAVTENLVQGYAGRLPAAVVRPSIVIGCDKDPLVGWINNFYGATGVATAASLGLMRVWYGDKDKTADIIPADKVVSAMLASIWYTWANYKDSEKKRVPIYNIISSSKAPTTWGEYMELIEENAIYSSMCHSKAVGDYNFRLQNRKWLYFIQMYIMHLFTGLIMDLYVLYKENKFKLMPAYVKIHKFNMTLSLYSTQKWKYEQYNVDNMWDQMTDHDRNVFNFDLSKFDWKEYHIFHLRAIRIYTVKDPMDTLHIARRKVFFLMKLRKYSKIAASLLIYYFFVHTYTAIIFRWYSVFINSCLSTLFSG